MAMNAPVRRNGNGISAPSPSIMSRLDPGPPYPGVNCHLVIDGVGYIMADIPSYAQESGRAVTSEQLAPYFGDPQNALDPMSSDMTMLLPIGQGDFNDGMGSTDLEKLPHAFDRAENLIVTPQGSLFNGPQVQLQSFTSNPNPHDVRGYAEGYFGGTVSEVGAVNYFGIGQNLFQQSGSAWTVAPARFPITDITGYSGRVIIGYGANGGDVFYNSAAYQAAFRITKAVVLNGSPFVMDAIGRQYAAFVLPPSAVSAADEPGPDTNLLNSAYAVRYLVKLPDNSLYSTGIGPLLFATKLPSRELVITIPAKGYRGGPVLRQLYRSPNNDLTDLYLVADETVLGSNMVRFVDTITDANLITKPKYDWNTQNTTGNLVLLAGETTRNMQYPDTRPIWLPENMVAPYVGDYVQSAEIFQDANGDSGVVIGTTSGLFVWDGTSNDFTVARAEPFHVLNFKYLAVNHGVVYSVTSGVNVIAWSPQQTVQIQGPWFTHFNRIDEIRLTTAGIYVAISVSGITRFDGQQACMVYLFDGIRFVWANRWNGSALATRPILGQLNNKNSLAWYKGDDTGINVIDLSAMAQPRQTSGVFFRSSSSDGELPRLRKQIHAIMVRYLNLTPQPESELTIAALPGDTQLTVASLTPYAIGDWIRIDSPELAKVEWRKITAINPGNIIAFDNPLGAPLLFSHTVGAMVCRCGAVATLRNVFIDSWSNATNIEVGGPCSATEPFAYIRLPQPVYAYTDGIDNVWRDGVLMELLGYAMLTGLNPQWNGLSDVTIRLQDYTKLPNNLYDNATAAERQAQLKAAFNKGTVTVIDPLGNEKIMRFQRLQFTYEEPKERHLDGQHMQATASVRLIDQLAELNKAENLVLGQIQTAQ